MKFIFDTDWFECLSDQPEGVRLEVYEAVMRYAADGTLRELKPMAKLAFNFIKKQIDQHRSRYEERCERNRINGNKGGRPSKNPKEPKKPSGFLKNPQKPTKTLYDNDNDNDNDYDYDNDNGSSNEDIKEKPSYEGKKKSASAPSELLEEYYRQSGDENYRKFLNWTKITTPYIAGHLRPLTEAQFLKLKEEYGSTVVRECMENLENRKDLRKKYSDLYRTLQNWCKREKGEES